MRNLPFLACLALLTFSCKSGDSTDKSTTDDTSEANDTDLPINTWNERLPDTDKLAVVRAFRPVRAVIHLHSPHSHDACDNFLDDCEDDPACDPKTAQAPTWCADDLKAGLCKTNFDVAFISNHPSYAVYTPFAQRVQPDSADKLIQDDKGLWGSERTCSDGHSFYWRVGFETSNLMPVGLHRAVDSDPEVANELIGGSDAATFKALQDAGANIMIAHLEERDVDDLIAWQDAGLQGLEIYSLHAAMSPTIREEAFGWDGLAWLTNAGDFLNGASQMPTDLFVLASLQAQPPTIANFDALTIRKPMMPTFGTDAHENVLPKVMSDGERADSFRRMLRWGSTMLLAKSDTPEGIDEAMDARRAYVAIEILGTPNGFDLRVDRDDGGVTEMGSTGGAGTLVVACPTLAPGSPRGDTDPVLDVRVLKDGQPFQQGCGQWPVSAGTYRVEIWQTPEHLRPFIDDALEDEFIKAYPWIYSGVVQVKAQ